MNKIGSMLDTEVKDIYLYHTFVRLAGFVIELEIRLLCLV